MPVVIAHPYRASTPVVPEQLAKLATALNDRAPELGLTQRLRDLRAALPGRIVLTTSFGLEAQAIAHAVFTNGIDVEVVTLDTGRLFPETHAVWAETEQRYGRRIRGVLPAHEEVEAFVAREGINGMHASPAARRACCHIRKVEPLRRALEGACGWITGIRGDQSGARGGMPYAAVDIERGLIKVNPLIDWSRSQVVEHVIANRIPYNALHDRGFVSIGCAPCTRAVKLGEDERAGRWWWEADEKRECGLHLAAMQPENAAPSRAAQAGRG